MIVSAVIVAVKDESIWYKACTKCYSRVNHSDICESCNIKSSFLRYRICLEVETKIGVKDIVIFGPTLNKYFGTSVDIFSKIVLQECCLSDNLKIKQAIFITFVGKSCTVSINNSKINELFEIEEIKNTVYEIYNRPSQVIPEKYFERPYYDFANVTNCTPEEYKCNSLNTNLEKYYSGTKSNIHSPFFHSNDAISMDKSSLFLSVNSLSSCDSFLYFLGKNKTMFHGSNNACTQLEKTEVLSGDESFFKLDDTLPNLYSIEHNDFIFTPKRKSVCWHWKDCPPLRRTCNLRKQFYLEQNAKIMNTKRENLDCNNNMQALLTNSIIEDMNKSFGEANSCVIKTNYDSKKATQCHKYSDNCINIHPAMTSTPKIEKVQYEKNANFEILSKCNSIKQNDLTDPADIEYSSMDLFEDI